MKNCCILVDLRNSSFFQVNPLVIGKAIVLFQDGDSDPDPEYLRKRMVWTKIKKYLMDHVQQFVSDIRKAIKNGYS